MTRSSKTAGAGVALSAIFFLSGGSALLFETLWFRLAGLAFGNSVWASALVLSSFMGGLALGNGIAARLGSRIRRPARFYAWVELAIAAVGVGLVLGFPVLTKLLAPILGGLVDTPIVLNLVRVVFAFLLLMVPATAMGMTLPLLVKALVGSRDNFGRALGLLYGWNTLGAVAGALAGEVFLIELLGVIGTGLAAGCLNLIAGVAAFVLSQSLEADPVEPDPQAKATPRPALSGRARRLLVASFLSGALLLGYEVLWFRFLLLFSQGTTLAFSVMLSIVLAGIGVGGLLASLWFTFSREAHRSTGVVAFLAGAVALLTYASFDGLLGERTEIPVSGYGIDILPAAFGLMFPLSVLSGVLFSLLGSALHAELEDETRATGLATLANTLGATLGPLLAGFLVIPLLGMERTFLYLGVAYALVALVALAPGGLRIGVRRMVEVVAAGVLVVGATLFPNGRMETYFGLASAGYRKDGSRIIAVREGLTETLQYLRRDFQGEPEFYRLVTNSFSMSGTHAAARRYMKYYVYWPVALLPELKSSLLISFGTGSTAKALTDTQELEEIVFVDTSREVFELADLVFPQAGSNPLVDGRVEAIVEDGRFFLQTTDRRFDLITSEPPPPKVAGVVSLYTREYFQLIHDRLTEGGVCTYWLPVVQLEESETRAILRAFVDVFGDQASLWSGCGLDWMMVGTRGSTEPVTPDRLRAQWEDPRIAGELFALGFEHPDQLAATFLMGPGELRALTAGDAPLTDDRPKRLSAWLETTPEAIDWHAGLMSVADTRARFEASEYAQGLWPDPTANLDRAYLGEEAIQKVTIPGGSTGLDFVLLHRLLTETDLIVPVLWSFGSSVRVVEIARAKDPGPETRTWRTAYFLGLDALARRDYLAAEELLRESGEKQANQALLSLRVLLFGLAERGDLAEALLEQERAFFEGSRGGRAFAGWYGETFGG